jgi:hypothetical protein
MSCQKNRPIWSFQSNPGVVEREFTVRMQFFLHEIVIFKYKSMERINLISINSLHLIRAGPGKINFQYFSKIKTFLEIHFLKLVFDGFF